MSETSASNPSASRSALILAFATIYVVWGSTYLSNRVAIESIPPFLMVSARFTFAGLVLGGWMLARGASWPTARQWRDNVIIGLLLLPAGTGMVVWSQQYIPSGLTALIIGGSPLFFALVEWAWPGGVAPNGATSLALVLGFAGVAWLASPWQDVSAGGLRLLPTAVILMSSLSWSIGSVYSRHTRERAPPLVGASVQMLVGGLMIALMALARGEPGTFVLSEVSSRSGFAFLYLVTMGSLVAFPTFIWLTQHASPARLSTYAYVNPVVAVALGWWILKEPIGPRTLASAAVILTAVAIITSQKRAKTEG